MTKRFVIYCRVSTAAQEDNTSLKSQERLCRALVKKHQGEVIEVVTEVMSGSLYLARTELQRAIRMVEAKQADAIAMLDLERFARQAAYQEIAYQRVTRAGGQILFVREDYPDTPEGRFQRGIKALASEYFREKQRILSIEGLIDLAERGIMPQRNKPPYAYRIVQEKEVLLGHPGPAGLYEIVPEFAPWAKKIFVWRSDKKSLNFIVSALQKQGAPTMYGGIWQAGTVSSILRNTAYMGRAAYGKTTVVVNEERLSEGKSHLSRRTRPRDEWIFIPCPALVSRGLWEKCQN